MERLAKENGVGLNDRVVLAIGERADPVSVGSEYRCTP
jgi:hypothetical protein